MTTRRLFIRLAAGCLVALAAIFAAPAAEAAIGCYADGDGDGYGAGALVNFDADVCPAGFVQKAGDCRDAVANVHPGRSEVGYNWEDDNCAFGTDEPTFQYSADGNQNTASSYRMTVNMNHTDIVNAALADALYVEIEYMKLSDSQNPIRFPRTKVLSFGDFTVNLTLLDLEPTTVYRSRVTFYKKVTANGYAQVGPRSDWYYTITDGTTFKTRRRALMVLKGFKELDESDREQVGYRGVAVDGTRYGAAVGEVWCSEFYAWVTGPWLVGLPDVDYWRDLIDFFDDAGAFYEPTEIPTRAGPGDYLPLDTDENGFINHSAMFLAYDASQTPARVWSLEGNSGNKVKVKSRVFTYTTWRLMTVGIYQQWVVDIGTFTGLGYILTSMLQ